MTNHLLNKTLQVAPEDERIALYYGRGQIRDDPVVALARDVADGSKTFAAALDEALSDYLKNGGALDRLEDTKNRLAKQIGDHAERIREGLENAPIAVIRPDLHPLVAEKLGIEHNALLNKQEISALLAGRRTDGELVEGKHYATTRVLPVDPKTRERRLSQPIGSYDFTPAPHKSVSVGWAFGNPLERAKIMQAYTEASRESMATLEEHIGQVRLGKGGQGGSMRGHVGWLEFTHHTARRVMVDIRDGEVVKLDHDQAAPGDPALHTHHLFPNAVVSKDGRVGSLDTAAISGLNFRLDAEFNARLAQKLRDAGFDVTIDDKTGAARMPAIPDNVSELFSKRSRVGEQWARLAARHEGVEWDDLTNQEQERRIDRYTQDKRQQLAKGEKDDVADFASWQRQAKHIGWEAPASFLRTGPEPPELTHEARIRRAYELALPELAKAFAQDAVLTHWQLQAAAARGLITTGSRDVASDILAVTRLMREEGIEQYGERTAIVWGQEPGKRTISVTTALHEAQEQEFVRLAQAAADDRSGALPVPLLHRKIRNSGLDFSDAHGKAQLAAIERLGGGGRFGFVIAAAGAGKTTALKPLVAAWHAQGRDVYGISLAWRQADDLTDAGIPTRNVKALSVFFVAAREGSITLGKRSVVAVDEWGLVGTRAALELMRLQERHGFSLVALGDDKQCSSLEAGSIIELSRKALGAEQVPDILTTKRQQTERERTIAGLFREGRAAEALEMKREDGTAVLAYGGYDGVVARVAKLYRERLEATGEAPTISAPTNFDAHTIGAAVRDQRRAMGLLSDDIRVIRATDGQRDFTLRLAKGDRVRLFRSVGASFADGRGGSIGRNGSVLEVLSADTRGLTLRNKHGRVGTVRWADLPQDRGRTQLAYGDAMTIHTAQGLTNREHISALPAGSQAIDGLLGYSAHTRHTQKLWLVSSDSAEQVAVRKSRPLNDTRSITTEDKWAQLARVLSYQPEKDTALSLFERVSAVRRGAVRAFHDVLPPHIGQQHSRSTRTRGHEVAQNQRRERSLSADLRTTMSLVIDGVRYAHQHAAQWSRDVGLFR